MSKISNSRRRVLMLLSALGLAWMGDLRSARGGALEDYVNQRDPFYNWKRTERKKIDGLTVTSLELVSQHWRDQFWSHYLQVVRPDPIRNPEIAFLFITGDGDGRGSLSLLRTLAERAGAVAAVLTKIPNQPLYDGRKEDALIAYTFDQYLRYQDATWPLLFPMVKSAVRGMDTVQAFIEQEFDQKIGRFVLGGASKRGWTTWLTGAVDPRVRGIAPMVIDVLNMRAQTRWAEKAYGKQSEQIQDYTDLNLIDRMDEPGMVTLTGWVDPYAYRDRYDMPKLLLLGTNDPYWVVDSLRHYWNDLREPKLIYQTPNAGHDLGGGKLATQTLAAWFQILADDQPLPKLTWEIGRQNHQKALIRIRFNHPAQYIRLWTADSKDRDFRDEKWISRDLTIDAGSDDLEAEVERPETGYRALLLELGLKAATGHDYQLSTEAAVIPDDLSITQTGECKGH